MHRLLRHTAAVLLILVPTLALAPSRLCSAQSSPVYAYCQTLVGTKPFTNVYSLIFTSDYGLDAWHYADPFEAWVIKNYPSLKDERKSTRCAPENSLDTIKRDRSASIDADKANGYVVYETRWPEAQ
jgi:hypothetical protein